MFHGRGGGPPWHGGPPGGRRGGWFMEPPIWGFLQPCLLLILAEGPQHGYSLMDELSRRKLLGSEVDVGNLYRTLRRMEGEGLVTSGWSDGAGPNKRVYHISERGTELLNFWAGTLEERTRVINRFINEYHRIFGTQGQPEPEFVANEDDNPI